jgi:hypothetical protein
MNYIAYILKRKVNLAVGHPPKMAKLGLYEITYQ